MIKKLFSNELRSRTITYLVLILLLLIEAIFSYTGNLTNLIKSLLVPLTCYMVAALCLNLVVGISGELSLGQAGFMSIGAFSAIVFAGSLETVITNDLLRLILAMIIGAIIAGIFGFIIGIPVLKLQGDYLAIVTLAFGEIIKSLINNVYLGVDSNGLHFSFVDNNVSLLPGGKMLLSGAMGATGNSRIANFPVGVILVFISLALIFNLIYSKDGRAIKAARDNRISTLSSGINITNVKMLAFVFAAILTGAAGALYGLNYSTVTSMKFDFNTSIMLLVYVVLGGLGNMTGTIISTAILVILPDMLRGLKDYRMLLYSLVLIIMMLLKNNQKISLFISNLKNKFLNKGAKNV